MVVPTPSVNPSARSEGFALASIGAVFESLSPRRIWQAPDAAALAHEASTSSRRKGASLESLRIQQQVRRKLCVRHSVQNNPHTQGI